MSATLEEASELYTQDPEKEAIAPSYASRVMIHPRAGIRSMLRVRPIWNAPTRQEFGKAWDRLSVQVPREEANSISATAN